MSESEMKQEDIRALAERIYDLDTEVYKHLGSSLGRVFNHDREKCVKELVTLMLKRTEGDVVRSELALIANMARTIRDRKARSRCMEKYNRILDQVMALPTSFADGDVLDPKLAKLNGFNSLQDRFGEKDHLIICISWTYGSGGINVGFKLSDKLKINYYDKEIFDAVLKRLDAEKDEEFKESFRYSSVQADLDPDQENLASAYAAAGRKSIKERIRDFSRYHGLNRQDAAFFNLSDLLIEKAKTEDFVIMGRCGSAIMKNNWIPHISIYLTAPMEQRIRRAMEINPGLDVKKARRYLHELDRRQAHHYKFYTGGQWGNANNYDICLNTASYGIDGTVNFILRMIGRADLIQEEEVRKEA